MDVMNKTFCRALWGFYLVLELLSVGLFVAGQLKAISLLLNTLVFAGMSYVLFPCIRR